MDQHSLSGTKYAIVDIETTGTSYKTGKITEVAILIHDGQKVIDEFSSLINPGQRIPYRIQQMTGISDRMVEEAPKFYEVAKQIVEMTEDCVFVAHNASFDYNFIRQEFKYLGFEYQREKICTVKLSRKLIPHKRSYSLKNLCAELRIENSRPHRAMGDARATAELFQMLLSIDPRPAEISLQGLNSNLDPQAIKNLPEEPGVYFFLDEEQNVIYVGKSKNIKSRVMAHLTNCTTKRALEMKNKMAAIDYELTGNELIALLLESHEIQNHMPRYNRAQRRTGYNTGIFHDVDKNGYIRFKICKLNDCNGEIPLTTFNSHMAAKRFLFELCEDYRLCQKLCNLYTTKNSCFQYKIHECYGACIGEEDPENYNKRAMQVVSRYEYSSGNFLIVGPGRKSDECSVVWVEEGRYHGFGFAPREINGFDEISYLQSCVQPYTENKHVHSIIRGFLEDPKQMQVIEIDRA